MDNVKIHEPLGNSDHNQIHVDINVKLKLKKVKVKLKKTYRRNFHNGKYIDILANT